MAKPDAVSVAPEAADALQKELGPQFKCDLRSDGVLCVVTPFLDDSNDMIHVFVRVGTGDDEGQYLVSDFGDSTSFLRMELDHLTEQERQLIKLSAAGTGVALVGGELLSRLSIENPRHPLATEVLDLAIAAMRVTHLRPRLRTRRAAS